MLNNNFSISDSDWLLFSNLFREFDCLQDIDSASLAKREDRLRQFICDFAFVLLEKNKVVNLTAIRTFEEALWKHFYDSFLLFHFEGLGRCLDWGTGGGFPGVPFAAFRKFILEEDAQITLLDSRRKKVNAIEEILLSIQFAECEYSFDRGEEHIISEYYDTVFFRAVAPYERLSKWLGPKIKQVILFLGPDNHKIWQDNYKNLEKRNFFIEESLNFELPRSMGERFLMKIVSKS